MSPTIDRPAAIRRALRDLVAERGLHGASMGAVAKEAGVAAGTAYVHYESKDELVYATYLEVKAELGEAVLAALDPSLGIEEQLVVIFSAIYRHLEEEPERALFLNQLEVSPYYPIAKERLAEQGDPLSEQGAAAMAAGHFVDLPPEVIYAFTFGIAVRLAATGVELDDEALEAVARASLRAVWAG